MQTDARRKRSGVKRVVVVIVVVVVVVDADGELKNRETPCGVCAPASVYVRERERRKRNACL